MIRTDYETVHKTKYVFISISAKESCIKQYLNISKRSTKKPLLQHSNNTLFFLNV